MVIFSKTVINTQAGKGVCVEAMQVSAQTPEREKKNICYLFLSHQGQCATNACFSFFVQIFSNEVSQIPLPGQLASVPAPKRQADKTDTQTDRRKSPASSVNMSTSRLILSPVSHCMFVFSSSSITSSIYFLFHFLFDQLKLFLV